MKKMYLVFTTIAFNVNVFAQRYSEPMDEEEAADFERYAHVGLSSGEKISIGVGIAMLLIGKLLSETSPKISVALFIIGGLCCLPLLMVILAVASKIISYAVVLAIIVGVIYFIFKGHKDI